MSARWRYTVQEALIGLRRNVVMTFAVILSVAVSLTLLGASLLLSEQVQLAAGEWTGKIEVSIFLCDGNQCPDITAGQLDELEGELGANPLVAEVFYESKQDAFVRFREQFADQPDLVETVTAEALPASFRVKLNDPEQFAAISSQYAAYPGVEEIIDQRRILQEFFRFANAIKYGAYAVALIQLVAAAFLVANTIRVAAFARREQTSVMKLVGASNWYIRLPFVLEGVIAGLAGALVAWGLVIAFIPAFRGMMEGIDFFPFIRIYPHGVWPVGPILILVGVGLSALSATVSLRRFLDV